MQNERAIVVFAFGWGQQFRLYQDHLYVRGKYYSLYDLIRVHPVYRTVMGIPSARLELQFGQKKLVLRGIAAVKDVQKAIEYLIPWCSGFDPSAVQAEAKQPRLEGRTEAPVSLHWSRTGQDEDTRKILPESRPALHEYSPVTRQEKSLRLVSAHQRNTLPIVSVPVRLSADEQAHYSTQATLCGERIGAGSNERKGYAGSVYPAQDQGMLILTNKRMIYIGRRSQIVLDYTHLMHVSHLRGAIAFEADHWQKRAIFEVPRPSECARYMGIILECFRRDELEMQDTMQTSFP